MHIHEAIKVRSPDKPFITRRAWNQYAGIWADARLRVLPTDTPDGCLMFSAFSARRPTRGWQPTAKDLTADDWEPIGPGRSFTTE